MSKPHSDREDISDKGLTEFLERRLAILRRWSVRNPGVSLEAAPIAPNTLRDLVAEGALVQRERGRLEFA